MSVCDHHSGELRAWIELHRGEEGWFAIGFLCGQQHPEVVVEFDGGKSPAGNALAETGWLLGKEAESLDEIMNEEAA